MSMQATIREKDNLLYREVAKMMGGNFEGYEKVYELSQKYIYKIINDIVQNHHTTEDLMQETYLQIFNKISSLKDEKAFYVWAGRIATNLTLRHIQKYRKELLTNQSEDEEDGNSIFDKMVNDHEEFIPESVLYNAEQQRIIAEILDELSVEQKLCVQYYYYEEMAVGDIAKLMECSEGTIKSRLNYARKALKEAIGRFEKTNKVKLYSMSAFPVFYLVFRGEAESLSVMAAGTAAGAVATAAQGSAGGSVAAIGNQAGNTLATAGATATVTGAGTATGSAVVGAKLAIIATSVCLGLGSAVGVTEVAKQRMMDDYGYVMTYEMAVEEEYPVEDETDGDREQSGDIDAKQEILNQSEDYNNISKLLGLNEQDVYETDAEYLVIVDELSGEMLRYREALEYSLTNEQYAYIDQLMSGYVSEVESYLAQGQTYAQLKVVDSSGIFETKYMPEMLAMLRSETEIVRVFADCYFEEEMKQALAQHSAQEMEEMLKSGGGIGDLAASHLSVELQNKLVSVSQELLKLINDMNDWANRVMLDVELSKYFK